jgi:uncharacterized membrane protein YedE/YeeE
MITPLIYAIGAVELENSTFILVVKCLIILIPVIVTERAEQLSPNLFVYLLICIATLAVVGAIVCLPFSLGTFSAYSLCYAVTIVLETILITITRIVDRLKRVEDFLSAKQPSIFDKPKVGYTWYFVVMYVIGLVFNSKMLCDIAFWVTIIYMGISFVHEYLTGTKHYLYLNNRIKGIPKKRLYGISAVMVMIFFLMCFVGILPSILTSGYRKYTDIRHWFDDMPEIEVELEGESGYMSESIQENPMLELIAQDTEVKEPSKLWNVLLWIIGGLCFGVLIYGFVKLIKQIFKDFRNTLDENGDIIEEIKDDDAMYKESELSLRARHLDSEAMRIRRRYKKTIKKHRKDLPAQYESPNEIEENAGLANDDEMKDLHSQYENARYGRL